jgi:hypothetical protein
MLLNLTSENGLAYFFLSISDEEKKVLQHRTLGRHDVQHNGTQHNYVACILLTQSCEVLHSGELTNIRLIKTICLIGSDRNFL